MKRAQKNLILSIITIVICLMLKVSVLSAETDDPNLDKDLRQISCTERSVTVKWNSQQGIDKYDKTIKREMDHYTLQLYKYITEDKQMKEYDKPYTVSFPENGSKEYTTTLKLPANYWGKVRVYLTYKKYIKNAKGEYEYDQTVTESPELYCNIMTKPTRPTKGQFGITDNIKSNDLMIKSWIKARPTRWFYGVELELYQGNRKLAAEDISILREKRFKLKKGCAYQYRIRYNLDYTIFLGNKRVCSEWSQWKGFVVPKNLSFASKPNQKGFQITLGKIAGVSKYTVYTSLKKKAGFKKAKTFKAKSKKKYSVRITKNYKKGKKNYIKIVPNIKLKYYKGPSDFSIVTPRPLKISK